MPHFDLSHATQVLRSSKYDMQPMQIFDFDVIPVVQESFYQMERVRHCRNITSILLLEVNNA